MGTPVTVKIKFKSDSLDQFVAQYATDINESGIFIRTPRPLATGTNVTFHFQLQDGSPLLSGNGTVVWVRESGPELGELSPGMGVRFDSLPPEGQAIIERVVRQKFESLPYEEDLPTRVAPEMMRKHQESEKAAAEYSPLDQLDELPLAETVAAPALSSPTPSLPSGAHSAVVQRWEPTESNESAELETQQDRRDRLERILFTEEAASPSGGDNAHSGAYPIDNDPGQQDAAVRIHPTYAGAARERRSSVGGWILLLVLLIAGGVGYYFFTQKKQPSTETAAPNHHNDDPTSSPSASSSARRDEALNAAQEASASDSSATAPNQASVTVSMRSTPEGARITIDGKDTGKITPAEISELNPNKEIEVAFDLPGKKLIRLTKRPRSDEPIEIDLSEVSKRTVRITSDPPDAIVMLGKQRIGQTPLDYDKPLVPTRRYELTFQLRGHKPHVMSIMPSEARWEREQEDEVLVLSAQLEPMSSAEPARPKTLRSRIRPTPRNVGRPPAVGGAATTPTTPLVPQKPAAGEDSEPEDKPAEGALKKPSLKIPSWGQ